jgi:histidyl-tRNA synthetase
MSKPSIPEGTRDFSPSQVRRRQYIFDIIKQTFEKFGFQPLETPAMENLSTLTGKYGDEGDQLLFKVLNNGDYLKSVPEDLLADKNSNKLVSHLSKRGLRYDLTVPFARYVVMHQNELSFPFKRYQIQPVWRADRPQRGRYREFWQCDVDIIGSESLVYEAQLVQIYTEVFKKLGLTVSIRLNHRGILQGMAEVLDLKEKFLDITIAVDKMDKVGAEGVKKELITRGISEEKASKLISLFGTTDLDLLEVELKNSEAGMIGISEIKSVQDFLSSENNSYPISLDFTLARGLTYYTGCIFEVVAENSKLGSIGGGGRYADLTGIFGLRGLSGVGISFGADRIYDVLEEQNLFPEGINNFLDVLIIPLSKEYIKDCFQISTNLRDKGVIADIYPEATKLQKSLKYANSNGLNWVILVGEEEITNKVLTLKNMESGEQSRLSFEDVVERMGM